jgi:hypothetical protein
LRVDAAANIVIDIAPDHDETQIGPPQGGRCDVDRIRCDRQFEVIGQAGDERQIGAPAVEEYKLSRLYQRSRRASEGLLAVASFFHTLRHGRHRFRQRQRAAVDPPTSTLRCEGAQIPADSVLGHLELERERRRHDGLAVRETAEDDISPGQRGFEGHTDILHEQERSCT